MRVRSRQDCGARRKSCLTYCGRCDADRVLFAWKESRVHEEMQVR